MDKKKDFQLSDLTPRELGIAKLMVRGYGNEVIASYFVCSKRSIANSVSTIYHKMGISRSRNEAIVKLLVLMDEAGMYSGV